MFKKIHIEHILALLPNKEIRILELGCGIPEYIIPYLKNPNYKISYVGIEPNPKSFSKAQDLLKNIPNAKIYNSLAYELPGTEINHPFDVCFSISVLEHVKHLDSFIKVGAKYLKKGGFMVHRYDLGHSLYPDSLKERLQLFISKYLPKIIPENKYISYIEVTKIINLYKENSVNYTRTTYHQMPAHKELLKKLDQSNTIKKEISEKIGREISEWEYNVSNTVDQLPVEIKEKLFPAICVWGKKYN